MERQYHEGLTTENLGSSLWSTYGGADTIAPGLLSALPPAA